MFGVKFALIFAGMLGRPRRLEKQVREKTWPSNQLKFREGLAFILVAFVTCLLLMFRRVARIGLSYPQSSPVCRSPVRICKCASVPALVAT